ncbi:MAG: CBS domain-containing protein [Actinobacteria bacterium]|nr:CBS domain-containing protein [Actinomycetota bacterium]
MSGMTAQQTAGIFYKTRVRDIMTQATVTCRVDAHVAHMARQMKSMNTGSVVVVDEDDRPLGIVTERDLVYKVVAAEPDSADAAARDLTAGDIMSTPPVVIEPEDFIFQAVGLMMRRRCRRLIVVRESGELAGILSMRDLMRFQAYDHRIIMDQVDKAHNVQELRGVREEIDDFVHRLFLVDVGGATLAEILTDFNDAISRRIIFVNELKLRAEDEPVPRCGFAWVAFGSEGRHEQVLRGDQDNAIILDDTCDSDRAREYYRELARRVNQDMADYGFELCDGGVMAREDKYFGTLTEWRRRTANLVVDSYSGQVLRDLTILLDMRHLAGDEKLTHSLWQHMMSSIQRNPPAMRLLAEDATSKAVPLNFLGRFRYEKDADGKRGINVKKFGMLPLIAGVKALAMEHAILPTSTTERIEALEAAGVLERDSAADLMFAHQLFLRLKLQASVETVFHGQKSTHFFYPEDWTDLERSNLRRAFKSIDHLLGFLRVHYSL